MFDLSPLGAPVIDYTMADHFARCERIECEHRGSGCLAARRGNDCPVSAVQVRISGRIRSARAVEFVFMPSGLNWWKVLLLDPFGAVCGTHYAMPYNVRAASSLPLEAGCWGGMGGTPPMSPSPRNVLRQSGAVATSAP